MLTAVKIPVLLFTLFHTILNHLGSHNRLAYSGAPPFVAASAPVSRLTRQWRRLFSGVFSTVASSERRAYSGRTSHMWTQHLRFSKAPPPRGERSPSVISQEFAVALGFLLRSDVFSSVFQIMPTPFIVPSMTGLKRNAAWRVRCAVMGGGGWIRDLVQGARPPGVGWPRTKQHAKLTEFAHEHKNIE